MPLLLNHLERCWRAPFLMFNVGFCLLSRHLGPRGGFELVLITPLIFACLMLDICLSNAAFIDIISMRLGKAVFQVEMDCLRCPQSQDVFGHHTLTCHMVGGKTQLRNMIRDEIYRTLHIGGLRCKLELVGLLPDLPGQWPADVVTLPTVLYRQSTWGLLPRLALDISVVSSFKQ